MTVSMCLADRIILEFKTSIREELPVCLNILLVKLKRFRELFLIRRIVLRSRPVSRARTTGFRCRRDELRSSPALSEVLVLTPMSHDVGDLR